MQLELEKLSYIVLSRKVIFYAILKYNAANVSPILKKKSKFKKLNGQGAASFEQCHRSTVKHCNCMYTVSNP